MKDYNIADALRRVAHSCAGASSTCGMRRLALILRELERQGREGQLTNAPELCKNVAMEFAQVRKILTPYQDAPAAPTAGTGS